MEPVIVTSTVGEWNVYTDTGCSSGKCPNSKVYVKPSYTAVPERSWVVEQNRYVNPVHPVKDHQTPPDCCNPVEIDVPLKKTCVYLSQTPVLLFVLLLSLVFLISCMYCWTACSCNNSDKHCCSRNKDSCTKSCNKGSNNNNNGNNCVSSSQMWTAFAVNAIIYLLFVVLISMWIYRLAQYNQTKSLGIAVAITIPIFSWFFFAAINRLTMGSTNNSCW